MKECCAKWSKTATFWARVPLGLFFVIAGWSKIQDPTMFEGMVKELAVLPGALETIFIVLLPWVELLAGAALVVGFWTEWAALLTSLMLLSFLIAMGWGHEMKPFSPNVVFLGASVSLMFTGSRVWSVDGMRKK